MENGKLFTGERFVPGIKDNKLTMEHYQRYLSVQKFVAGKVVLDAACGEGYGSSLLAQYAKKVTGVDIDAGAIQRAKENYGKQSNVAFQQGSIEKLELADNSVDVVVSFETIEHVSEAIQKGFLDEIDRVLKSDGVLIMSTPNKKIYSDLHQYHNEFHVKEFYHDEFLEFLHRKFSYIKLYNQAFRVVLALNACDGSDENLVSYGENTEYDDSGKYYIAVAAHTTIADPKLASIYMGESEEYEKNIARILTLQEEEEVRNRHIKKLDNEISGNRMQIEALTEEKREVENEKAELESEKAQLETEKIALETELISKETQLEALQQSERDLQHQVAELKQEVMNKEGHINQLLESDRELANIKNSHSWRVTLRVANLSRAVLPVESRRRLLVKMAARLLRHPVRSVRMLSPRKIRHFFYYLKEEGPGFVAKRMDESMKGVKVDSLQLDLIGNNGEKKEFESNEKLIFPKHENPQVSIVIPVYNQFDYTYNCLQSILNNTGDNVTYEIIIANDCSTDDTTRLEEVVENIMVVTNETNLRFLRNCNHAAEYARGQYILFLNNDTQVQKNWLLPLVELIESKEEIGMVGSKLVYADGRLQEAGGIIWNDASAWNYGNRCDPTDPEYNYVKEVDYISGAAIMIRTSLWKEIGGFDELFAPAYYEDTDLACEVRAHGYKVMYQPLSVVVHFEGVSNGTDVNAGQKAYQVANQKKFYEKWKNVLEKENFANAQNVFLAKDRGQMKKKTLLFVDHYVPMYDKDAGSRCMFYYLKLFVKMGYNIKFIGDNFFKHEPYTTTLQQMGIEVLYGNYYFSNWKSWIVSNGKYFDYAFLSRPHISVKYIDLVRANSKAKIIYFGHDLHYLRERREYELNGNEQCLKDSREWKRKELSLMRKADISYYLSNVELEEIAKVDPNIRVRRVPINIYDEFPKLEYKAEQRQDILFVGGFGHPPNTDAVTWLGETIMPAIWEKNPNIVLHVVGSKPPKEIQAFNSERMVIHGFVSDEDLEEMYRNIKLALVPLRYGAGIKGKIIEAMMRGIPMVTTSIGIEGIDGAEKIAKVSDDATELANTVADLYNDTAQLEKMAQEEHRYIEENYSVENAVKILGEDFAF